MRPEKKIYAVYRGEEMLCDGLMSECAKHLGVSVYKLRWLASPSYHKRMSRYGGKRKNTKGALMVVKIDDGDDD